MRVYDSEVDDKNDGDVDGEVYGGDDGESRIGSERVACGAMWLESAFDFFLKRECVSN